MTRSVVITVLVRGARLVAGFAASISIPQNGQIAEFLNQIPGFAPLPAQFQETLRVSSALPISVIGLRGRYNERGDFLITTTPAADETAAAQMGGLFFPHIVDSGGYTTQFILFSSGTAQSSSGVIQILSSSGGPLKMSLQ